jgi:hypothetical protein
MASTRGALARRRRQRESETQANDTAITNHIDSNSNSANNSNSNSNIDSHSDSDDDVGDSKRNSLPSDNNDHVPIKDENLQSIVWELQQLRYRITLGGHGTERDDIITLEANNGWYHLPQQLSRAILSPNHDHPLIVTRTDQGCCCNGKHIKHTPLRRENHFLLYATDCGDTIRIGYCCPFPNCYFRICLTCSKIKGNILSFKKDCKIINDDTKWSTTTPKVSIPDTLPSSLFMAPEAMLKHFICGICLNDIPRVPFEFVGSDGSALCGHIGILVIVIALFDSKEQVIHSYVTVGMFINRMQGTY